jgi:hypothetical protein
VLVVLYVWESDVLLSEIKVMGTSKQQLVPTVLIENALYVSRLKLGRGRE